MVMLAFNSRRDETETRRKDKDRGRASNTESPLSRGSRVHRASL